MFYESVSSQTYCEALISSTSVYLFTFWHPDDSFLHLAGLDNSSIASHGIKNVNKETARIKVGKLLKKKKSQKQATAHCS